MRRLSDVLAWGVFALILFIFSPPFSTPALADKRVALVVGIGSYQHAPELPNPTRDAKAIAEMFQKAGFDAVQVRYDVGNLDFKRALRDFFDVAKNADIAVVFFAGHGIQIGDQNYMIPVDAKLAREYDAKDEAISLERIVEAIEPAARLRLVILDACRDNPFLARMQRKIATRAVPAGGLARVEPTYTDTLIAYAAKAGSTADDGDSEHSPFTRALLNHIAEPGLDVRLAFGRIRDEVRKMTRDEQEPFVYGSLGGSNISLVPPPAVPKAAALSEVKGDYELVERINSRKAWEVFINHHKEGIYVDLARERMRMMDSGDNSAGDRGGQRLASLPPPPAPIAPTREEDTAWNRVKESEDPDAIRRFIERNKSSPHVLAAQSLLERLEKAVREKAEATAEAKRLADTKRLAEEKAAAEVKRLAEEARKQAETKRLVEEKAAADAKRLADEARKQAETKRLAEERAAAEAERVRKAEETRKQAEGKRLTEEQATAEAKRLIEDTRRQVEARKLAEEKAAAEAKRLVEEAKKQVDTKRLAEERAAAESERVRKAEEARKQSEAKRLAEEKAALDAKKSAEQNSTAEAERMKKAEEARKQAEARRIAEEKAGTEARRIAEERAAEAERVRQAEAKRLAEEKAAAEARRVAEEKAVAEAKRIAGEKAAEAERVRKAEEARKQAETKRLAAEKAAAEAKRIAEEKAATEARRLAEKAAADAERTRKAEEAKRVAEAKKLADEQAVAEVKTVRLAQLELRRIGCFSGRDDGLLNQATKDAIGLYHSKLGKRSIKLDITDEFVDELKRQQRVCPLVCKEDQIAQGDQCVAKAAPEKAEKIKPAQKQRAKEEPRQASKPQRRDDDPPARVRQREAGSGGRGGGGGTMTGVGF